MGNAQVLIFCWFLALHVKINVFTFEKKKKSVSIAIGGANICRLNYAITYNMHLNFVYSNFKIILKLPSVKSSACLSKPPGTELEGSVVPINKVAWSAMCETR